ncbi:MAG TPA: hypothetical protein VGO62_01090, partial [Myxococcota bacterium]
MPAPKAGQRERLDEIEKRLDELRHKYDLYFQGSKEQRTPPTNAQAQMGGELRRIREDETRTWNTIDKFRFMQIFARFVSLDRLWARTMKQIEDGTWKRDKMKVALKKAKEAEQQPPQQQPSDTQVGKRPAAARPPTAPASANGQGMTDQRLKQLYDVYMQAKKRTGEQSNLTMDAL